MEVFPCHVYSLNNKYHNYLHSTYIMFSIISNLEVIYSTREDVYRLYLNTMPEDCI